MWQRARSEEQIEERVVAILDATSTLLKTSELEEITVSAIAEEANFTRSNIYKYFPTREDILLAILQQDMRFWRKSVEKKFKPPQDDLREFCQDWVDLQLKKYKRMISLQTILYTVIEKKCSYDKLVEFKLVTRDEYYLVTQHLLNLFPKLTPEKAGEFVYSQMAMTRGVFPMLNPLPKQKDAMKEAELRTDFDSYRVLLINAVEAMLVSALK